MKRFFLLALTLIPLVCGAETSRDLFPSGQTLVIDNRVLAKVNGKPITVMDLVRKMDLVFHQRFPEHAKSQQARYQFYQANWRVLLQDLIDNELILAEAAEKKIVISDGDVRAEMEKLFGPNVVLTLDGVGLTYDEAWKLVKSDLTVQRMMSIMVHAPAVLSLKPKDVHQAYQRYASEARGDDTWRYQILTVRGDDAVKTEKVVSLAAQLLTDKICSFTELPDALRARGHDSGISISEEYQRAPKAISENHKRILTALEPGAHSHPIAQSSRSDGHPIYRIFFLYERSNGEPPSFSKIQVELHQTLLQSALDAEAEQYLQRLRQDYHVDEVSLSEWIPEGYKPFSLR